MFAAEAVPVLDSGATAWMLVSASLVLLMTPALAFFYGGMSNSKSVLNMMMMSFGVLAVVGVIYPIYGWSMSYGGSSIAGIFGNPFEQLGLQGTITDEAGEYIINAFGVPQIVDVAFQVTFAMITAALISGALVSRVKYGTWLVFVALWVTVVYFPMAHMVWNAAGGGLLSGGGPIANAIIAPIDFAGGTVVHINAGIAAFVLALVVGKRPGFGRTPHRPHNIPFVMLGAALLWFGWFGFNAGSAFTADGNAGLAWVNTTVATCAATLGWILTEQLRFKKMTSLGAASGVVAGLVAITPAAGSLSPMGSIVLGLIAGAVCSLAIDLKFKFGFDDSLDVVGVHLVGGLIGTVAIGFLSTSTGLFYGHGLAQLASQVIVALVALIYAGVLTLVIALVLKATMGWRLSAEEELRGIDVQAHGESAYEMALPNAHL